MKDKKPTRIVLMARLEFLLKRMMTMEIENADLKARNRDLSDRLNQILDIAVDDDETEKTIEPAAPEEM